MVVSRSATDIITHSRSKRHQHRCADARECKGADEVEKSESSGQDRHAEDFIFQEKNPVDVLKALSDQTESVLDKGVEKRLESDDAVYSR